jgi:hypothetical protein
MDIAFPSGFHQEGHILACRFLPAGGNFGEDRHLTFQGNRFAGGAEGDLLRVDRSGKKIINSIALFTEKFINRHKTSSRYNYHLMILIISLRENQVSGGLSSSPPSFPESGWS